MITVKHKAGRFIADLRSVCYVTFRFLFKSYVEMRVKIKNSPCLPVDMQEEDWLKIGGWKSGFRTKTNRERIAVYRKTRTGVLQTAIYDRYPNGMFIVSNVLTHPLDIDIVFCLEVPYKRWWWPVFPWAGGTYPPNQNFKYQVK